uniref:Solute carrier family 25 member 36 n=1 Tax=Schistocephalus solidus TaxID=70667 RepID=A0A0X3PKF5_SCHSO
MIDGPCTPTASAIFHGWLPGIYFCAYHKGQKFFQEYFSEGHSAVYLFSAGVGSITASTLTSPIWYIKTRLQLDSSHCSTPVTVSQAIRSTWKELGFRGFYRGITASYVGSIETALNFVIYENTKGHLLRWDRLRRRSETTYPPPIFACCTSDHSEQQQEEACSAIDFSLTSNNLRGTQGGSKLSTSSDMMLCMLASGFSKTVAITIAYPHEVARTRMREQGTKYRTFLGTMRTVFAEDGFLGLYRGLGTHYIRQIPNSCLMIGTYEGVVFLLDSWDLVKRT